MDGLIEIPSPLAEPLATPFALLGGLLLLILSKVTPPGASAIDEDPNLTVVVVGGKMF